MLLGDPALTTSTMGLASQLQQFQQQGGAAAPSGGASNQGASTQSQQQPYPGQPQTPQYQQQSFQNPQYPQQGFQPQQQQQQYPQQGFQPQQSWQQQSSQGGYPQIQQNWQQQNAAHNAPAPNQQYQGYVTSKLQQMVATNQLQAFYPPQRLQQVVEKVLRVDLRYTLLLIAPPPQQQIGFNITCSLCASACQPLDIMRSLTLLLQQPCASQHACRHRKSTQKTQSTKLHSEDRDRAVAYVHLNWHS